MRTANTPSENALNRSGVAARSAGNLLCDVTGPVFVGEPWREALTMLPSGADI
jgi:hypothetical protein